MFSMKSKPKTTLRQDRNDDLSVLTSIQRYRRQPTSQVPTAGGNARGRGGRSGSNGLPGRWDAAASSNASMQSEDKENTTGTAPSLFQKNPSKTYTDPRTGRVTISCVPNLITASQTRYILQTVPTNGPATHSQLQKDRNHSRSDLCISRPVSRNSRSSWAIFSTEPVTRAEAAGANDSQRRSIVNGLPQDYPSQSRSSGIVPALKHTIVKPRLNFNSPNPSWASASVFGHSSASLVGGNTFVQGSWVERSSSCNKALTNPDITRQYSIAELMDILCGVAPIPDPKMFYQYTLTEDGGDNSVTGFEVFGDPVNTEPQPVDTFGLWADETVSIPIPITQDRDEPFKRKLLKDFETARMDKKPFINSTGSRSIKPTVCRALFGNDLDSGNGVDSIISGNSSGGGLSNILENYCSFSYDFMSEGDNNLLGDDYSEWNPLVKDPTA